MVITLNDGTTQTIDADNFRGLLTELGTLIAIECQKARREQAAKDAAIVRKRVEEFFHERAGGQGAHEYFLKIAMEIESDGR